MKDMLYLPAAFGILAQAPPDIGTWERFGIAGFSIGATIFIWRYFVSKEAAAAAEEKTRSEAREKETSDARKELQEKANALQEQVVTLLTTQIAKSDAVASELVSSQKKLILVHEDTKRMHEDNHRALKDLTRKMTISNRHVTIDNDPGHPVPITEVSE